MTQPRCPFPRAGISTAALALALALALSVQTGCGAPPGPATTPVGPDTSSFQATWKPATAVLDAATVAAELRNPRTTDGVYAFDPASPQARALQPGQTLVLSGVDVVTIDAVDPTPDAVLVTTEPASLLDAASDLDASWDVATDVPPSLHPQAAGGLHLASDLVLDCASGDGGACTPTQTFSGMLGNLQATESLALGADGATTWTGSLAYPLTGGSVFTLKATATLKSFRYRGTIDIRAGALHHASLDITGLDLDVDLYLGGVALATSGATFDWPIEADFPFMLGPIPTYFRAGLSVDVRSTLAAQSSAQAQLHFHVTGDMGLEATGTTVTGTGAFDVAAGAVPSVTDTQVVSTQTDGLGATLSVPKVAIGIGLAHLPSAEAYLTGKMEGVINEAIHLGGLGLIQGNCTTVNADVGAYAGGNVRLLGIDLKKEIQLAGHAYQPFQAGNPSDAQCP